MCMRKMVNVFNNQALFSSTTGLLALLLVITKLQSYCEVGVVARASRTAALTVYGLELGRSTFLIDCLFFSWSTPRLVIDI